MMPFPHPAVTETVSVCAQPKESYQHTQQAAACVLSPATTSNALSATPGWMRKRQ